MQRFAVLTLVLAALAATPAPAAAAAPEGWDELINGPGRSKVRPQFQSESVLVRFTELHWSSSADPADATRGMQEGFGIGGDPGGQG